jgi:putative hydrolase of the HAD superfamily
VRAYRSHKPRIELFPDARRFIDQARSLALPMALITDGPAQSQRAKIDALALEDAFAPIVVTAELGQGLSKPHPAAFELVEETLGRGLNYIYIADNPLKDFLAPNRLGWTSIRIQRPGGLHSQAIEPTPAHAPRHSVASLDDVWQLHKQRSPAVKKGFTSN